ncbi:lymphotoxin-alpha-like [Nematolebias whitei]|uniref:lymphotoxin-alpha-like n=1 Tax=Nematolebias whitei TaxID=451745 RepID=UPI0018985B2D|nr:lymphotoxin-alpha-like [Nematolebias whitei]
MEKRSRTPQLVDDWELSSMEEDGCRCACEGGAEAGFHLQQLGLRATARRAVLAALALLLVGLVAALVTAGLGLRELRPKSSQHNKVDFLQSGVDGNQQVETPASKDLSGSKKPGARLTASNISNPHGKYLLWESKEGNVHCNGGFLYSDGDLVVPRQGYYRVYVQMTFEGEAESCKSDVLLLTYSVFCYHDSYQRDLMLLTAVDTTTCPKNWKKSLYSSSVFFLEANSRLRVTSSLSNHVLKNEYETFFGADLLPD